MGKFKKLSYVIVFVVIILILLVLTFSDRGFYDNYVYRKKLNELQTTIDSLKRVNDSLAVEIELLRTSNDKIEKVAREKYGMIKPGEKVYRIRIEE
jgi:cell division protein FtsB